MLVITRGEDEEILIGDDIRVRVISAVRGKVRLGILAPREVLVDRPEVRERREREGGGGEQA